MFSISGFHLQAQVIVEQQNVLTSSKVCFKTTFDKSNYNERLTTYGTKIYTKKEENVLVKNQEENFNVTITFQYEEGLFGPNNVQILNESGYDNTQYWSDWSESGAIQISVPKGKNDIIGTFWKANAGQAYVIKELIDIDKDTIININVNDAKNHIITEAYNEKNELMEPGIISEDWSTVIGGNIEEMVMTRFFILTNTGYLLRSFSTNWPYKDYEGYNTTNFYISNVSDRYLIAQTRISLGKEGQTYFNKYVCSDITESLTLKNNPQDYVIHEAKFKISPMGQFTEKHYPGFNVFQIWNGNSLGLSWVGVNYSKEISQNEGVKLFLDNPISNPNGYNILVHPKFVDYIKIITDEEGYSEQQEKMTTGSALVLNIDRTLICAYNGFAHAGNYTFQKTEDGKIKNLPYHPRFSFALDNNPNIIQGNNSPFASVRMNNSYNESLENKQSFLTPYYIGRYGETKASDYDSTTVVVKYNNDIVYSDKYANFDTFMYQWASEKHPDGLFDVTFTNLNVEVDGLAGKNVTQVVYDWTKDDWTPPTLQMLQFRNTSGAVTDRFSNAAEGTVRLSAGDFEYVSDLFYYKYVEGNTVALFYSLYDQNNWTELPLTEYPEHFFMPGFGDYYEASLAGIEQAGSNVWYDVKIVCTDAAGNSQTQVVSPAFKLNEDGSNISESHVSNSDVNVIQKDKTLLFSADNSIINTISIYNTYGKAVFISPTLSQSNYQIASTGFNKGVYIASVVTDKGVETIKFIIK